MTQHLGRGVLGVVVFALVGCGGTVDLRTPDGGAGAGRGGSDTGGTDSPGGSSYGGVNVYAGEGGTTNRGGDPNIAGMGNTSGAQAMPPEGVLAYDDDHTGLGRTIALRKFTEECVQTLTDPSVQAKQPAFSTDGKLLAYAAQDAGVYQIYVRTLESGDTEQVTTLMGGATSPTFSPDGKQLAFVTGDPETFANKVGDSGVLMLVDLETKETSEVLTAPGDMQYNSPVFHGAGELVVGTTTSLVGIDLKTKKARDIVPITGRIPNPRDPSLAPDGLRYVFSDFCGSGLGLYIARIDGSTGDTCASALPFGSPNTVSADWGQNGYIAAELKAPGHGLTIEMDPTLARPYGFGQWVGVGYPGRNPAWAPMDAQPELTCDVVK